MPLDLDILNGIAVADVPRAILHLSARQMAETPEQLTSAATNDEPLMDAEQIAARLGVKPSQIYALARAGKLPVVNVGRWRRFRPADVEHALESRRR